MRSKPSPPSFVWELRRRSRAVKSGEYILPASEQAHSFFGQSLLVLAVCAAIFLILFSLLVYPVLKFRKRPNDDTREPAQSRLNMTPRHPQKRPHVAKDQAAGFVLNSIVDSPFTKALRIAPIGA